MQSLKALHLVCSLLMIVLSTSCGLNAHLDKKKKPAGYVRQFSTTDTTFKTYVKNFEDHAKIKTGNINYKVGDIPVNFGDTENDQFVGVCFTYSDGTKEVLIRKTWWDRSSSAAKESLIFHELGHCALDRDHNEETIQNSEGKTLRASIMHPSIVSANHFTEYYDGYVHELFTSDRGILTSLFK